MIRSLRPGKGLLIPSYGTVAPDITYATQRRLPTELDPNPIRKARQYRWAVYAILSYLVSINTCP